MVSMGMLMKLYRDLYCIIPLSADQETYSPDSRLVARCIMKGKGYYIAYSSAMYIHGLTDHPGAMLQRSVICFSPTFLNWNGHPTIKDCLMTAEQAFHS